MPNKRVPGTWISDVDPTSGEDRAAGYTTGDRWINQTTPSTWTLVDHDPGAWVEEDGSGGGGGGSGTPATTVTSERTLNHAATAVGVSTDYARADHSHGTPAMPSASDVGADASGAAAAALVTAEAYTDTAVAGRVPTTRTVSTTAPLTGGGSLAADRTIAVSNATTGAVGVVKLAGQLGGTATSPTVTGLTETSGPTALALGSIPDGYYLARSGAGVIGVAGSLIGASHTRFDPDLAPASVTSALVAPSCEFADAQSNGGWTNSFDPGSFGVSEAVGLDGLEVSTTAAGGFAVGGYYHSTFPSGDFTVMAKLHLNASYTASAFGLCLMQGTGATDDIYFVGMYHAGITAPASNGWATYFTAYNAAGSDIVYQAQGKPIYVQMRYQASTHHVTSWMGVHPENMTLFDLDRTLANAPTKLGLLVGRSSTARVCRGTCSWVRVISDTYSSSGTQDPPRLTGSRVADY